MKYIQCRNCGFLNPEDRTSATCMICGKPVGDAPESSFPAIILFKEGLYEHIAPKPIHISSMRQLKQVCKEHGVVSKYAEDS